MTIWCIRVHFGNRSRDLISDHRIPRKMASLIFQLRCRHVPLNQFLYWFCRVDNDRCPACGTQPETVDHFFFQCPNYAHKRWPLLKLYNRVIPPITEILSNEKNMLQTINYIQATERFCHCITVKNVSLIYYITVKSISLIYCIAIKIISLIYCIAVKKSILDLLHCYKKYTFDLLYCYKKYIFDPMYCCKNYIL